MSVLTFTVKQVRDCQSWAQKSFGWWVSVPEILNNKKYSLRNQYYHAKSLI